MTMINILLADDSPEDIDLAMEALEGTKLANNVSVVHDGVEALAFLRRQGKHASAPRPSLIFLDLNMPKKDGREVLEEIKNDPDLKGIPVVILTTSKDEEDIAKIVSKWTGIPVDKMLEGERGKLLRMEDELARRVVGQAEAVAAVATAVRRARAGERDEAVLALPL